VTECDVGQVASRRWAGLDSCARAVPLPRCVAADIDAELGWLAGAIEHAGGRVTERDLNYVEDSAELFYERDGERYEIHLKRLPDPLPG
jgi:hypothetical protein